MMIIKRQYIDVVEVLQVANNKPKMPELNLENLASSQIFSVKINKNIF